MVTELGNKERLHACKNRS